MNKHRLLRKILAGSKNIRFNVLTKIAPAVFLVLMVCGGVCAESGKGIPQSPITQLLEVTGRKGQLGDFTSMMAQDLIQRKAQMEPKQYEVWHDAMAESFDGDRLYQETVDYFTLHSEPAKLKAVLSWYQSPLGVRVSRAESTVLTPEIQKDMQAFGAAVQKKPPAKERTDLIRELDRASGSTDTTLRFVTTFTRVVMNQAAADAPPDQRPTHQQMEARLQEIIEGSKPALQESIVANLLYEYRDFTDDDLRKQLAFLDSPDGKWFTELSNGALTTVLVNAEEKAFNRMMQEPRK